MNKYEKAIQEFIEDVCDILQIKVPKVSSDFPVVEEVTDTTLALCDPSGEIIYLRKPYDLNLDLFSDIAHELRHVWQIKTNQPMFQEYLPSSLCESIEQYNLQEAEVDASAFAGIIMEDFFDVTPLFIGLSNPVKRAIRQRMESLWEEYGE